MVSRSFGNVDDLFNDQLRRFKSSIFINIKFVGQSYDTAVCWSGLIEGNGVHRAATCGRLHTELEMVLTDRALFVDAKVATKHRLRKSGAPRAALA